MNDIPSELIEQASRGDLAAFEEIYRQTSPYVYSIALRVLANNEEAEDVTQEVFIRVHGNLKGFGFRSAFKTWLYRITMNASLNAIKRRARHVEGRVEYDGAADTLTARATKPETPRALIDEEEVARLLAPLSPEHRACLVLREIEGLSYEEMADALHININTVRSRLKRAREALLEKSGREVTHDDL